MTVTVPIFTKLTLARERFVKNFDTEFHENEKDSLVAAARSQIERRPDAVPT
jgi:hypothetical protein